MGVLHDVFIATEDEVAAFDVQRGAGRLVDETGSEPTERTSTKRRRWWKRESAAPDVAAGSSAPILPTVDAKGTGDIPLATLELLLAGESIDDVDRVVDLLGQPIKVGDDQEGPWLFRVNDRLVDQLAAADRDRLSEVAGPWVATEEMEGWGEDEALDLIVRLSELFREAKSEGKTAYLWTSL